MYTCFNLHTIVIDYNVTCGTNDYNGLDKDMPQVDDCALVTSFVLNDDAEPTSPNNTEQCLKKY